MNKAYLRDALLVTGGLTLGGGAGFLIAKKALEAKYENLLVDEVADIRRAYKRAAEQKELKDGWRESTVFVKTSEPPTTEQLMEAVADAEGVDVEEVASRLKDYGSESIVQNEPEVGEPIVRPIEKDEDDFDEEQHELENSAEARLRLGQQRVHNIFNDPRSQHPLGDADEGEETPRDETVPYIITVDEFMTEQDDYNKITITYFEVDKVLIDEREETIDDVARTVGTNSLNRFGQDSGDETIVYVRNHRLRADFEIVKDEGSYAQTVLGLDDHETYEPKQKRRKKPRDDD